MRIGPYTRVYQADGRRAWFDSNFVDLATLLGSEQAKNIRFTATGDYRGQSFSMTVPAGSNPGNAPLIVQTPFVLEPAGFDEALQGPGATTIIADQVHS